MKLIKYTIKVVLIFVVSFSSSCIFHQNKERMKEYNIRSEEAKSFFIKDEFDKAEESYKIALNQAEKMNWIDGIIITKTNLGIVFTARSDYLQAEEVYIQARDICKNNPECSPQHFAYVYDYLVRLYLYKLKDISKAEQTAEEVINFRQRLSQDKAIKERLYDYANYMKINGFERQSVSLVKRIESL